VCFASKPKKPDILPGAPPTPEEPPQAPVLNEDKGAGLAQAKRSGFNIFRIDPNPAMSASLYGR
jgi:hypothetical protein